MKKMRIPLLIAWGIAVLGIILESFLDLNIWGAFIILALLFITNEIIAHIKPLQLQEEVKQKEE